MHPVIGQLVMKMLVRVKESVWKNRVWVLVWCGCGVCRCGDEYLKLEAQVQRGEPNIYLKG